MHHHPGSHDPVLVALSVLIAALSSYTALDLATRMRAASGPASLGWLGAAAVAMGGGIWSMHFVAMLAFNLPGIDVSYDPLLTLLSLAIPILVAAAAFVVVSLRPTALVVAGKAKDLKAGFDLATRSVDSGEAEGRLDRLIVVSNDG